MERRSSKSSPHVNPAKAHHSASKSRRRGTSIERDVPIKVISIERDEEGRDDEIDNVLITLIQQHDWIGIVARIKTQEGVDEASRAQSTKDYALHYLCKCGHNYNKVSTYGSFRSSPTTESGKSIEVSGRGGSSLSGSGSYQTLESVATNDHSEETAHKSLPSEAVLEAVMNAYPDAVKLPGSGELTPLHWAVRYGYPLELLNVLIRAFPQALDMKDAGTRTPRHFANSTKHPRTRTALLRPTSCWLQHLHDERVYEEMAQEIAELENELEILLNALEESLSEEELVKQRVTKLEAELDSFGDLTHAKGFADKAAKVYEELERSMDVIRGTLEGLVGQTILKYAEEEKERALLASFNSDVERIYNNANEGMEEMKSDLQQIIRRL